jgi:hypothetical protein
VTLAYATNKSANGKTGPGVAVTGAAQASCPPTCPFLGQGCYAENGPQGWQTSKLNKAAVDATPSDIALEEAAKIVALPGNKPLRLHVVGDCASDETAQIVSSAAEQYAAKHDKPVWTYTHAWRDVDRRSWGSVSVLASCETAEDVADAHARGYAVALVTHDPHPGPERYELDGIEVIPCPQQTGRAENCGECLLCIHDDYLLNAERVIGFEAHGKVGLVQEAINQRKTAYAPVG